MIGVVAAGALTTIQDLGRPGAGALGVPPSGAMDPLALRVANLLVGNEQDAAALEITLTGPTLEFERGATIALAGSWFEATLDGTPVPHAQAALVRAGQTLRIGRSLEGARGILAVRGGIAADPVLGARATHVAAGLGPAIVRAGDRLPMGPEPDAPVRQLQQPLLPLYEHHAVVRVVPGPQAAAFDADAFYAATWTVSSRADRTGIRLEGPAIAGPPELEPEGVAAGSIQVPGDGAPIVLGPDRPITGGYAKVAAVIDADWPAVANARPGDTLRFMPATIDEARAAWFERERALLDAFEDR